MRKSLVTWMLLSTLALVSMPAAAQEAPEGAREALGAPQEAEGPVYPTRVYRAGDTVREAKGFLVHPARFREMRVLLVETLPRCEQSLSQCQEDLAESPLEMPEVPEDPSPPPSSWGERLTWTATGVGVGVALGTLGTLALVLALGAGS